MLISNLNFYPKSEFVYTYISFSSLSFSFIHFIKFLSYPFSILNIKNYYLDNRASSLKKSTVPPSRSITLLRSLFIHLYIYKL